MKKWLEVWVGMGCVAAVFLVGLVGFAPTEQAQTGRTTLRGGAVLGAEKVEKEPQNTLVPENTTLRVVFGDEIRVMALEDYVYGVVAAEMPAAFPEAALEAQAVAARTYALYQSGAGKHADAGGDVCGDSTCCQAFAVQAELDARWGADAAFYTEKLRGAVAATKGEILTYGGEIAAAVYHASSDGSTRSAAEVWGGAQPYLTAVETPEETGQKGHGVGMSQRGAEALARTGYSYRKILAHYYPGTALQAINGA